ncbi:oligosaccharide flippase family protein [Cobetia sp. LC6]|uniref:lipopolysaccharide biosynthesis protein n=1 Tax=Cobetia sp. LC6 TaxID=3050947 RepID=UPI0025566626|nr:oligosaccharide flippase family protein [Cobetia sp. LC6]MDL2192668.1 oligosaccharide flippase family protein [Cobetia sp. LC6]
MAGNQSMFLKNVTLVAAGTALAQVITIVATPAVTRIYGPEAFGLLGVFSAVLSIVTPLSAFSYPIAIVLPKDDNEALDIAKLSLIIALATSIIAFLFLILFGEWLVSIFNIQEIYSYIYMIPFAMFFTALLAVVSQWIIRNKFFLTKSKVAVFNSILINLSKIGLGLAFPVAGLLVFITALNSMTHSVLLLIKLSRDNTKREISKTSKQTYVRILKRYQDFFLYRTPQVFLNALSQSLPVIMLTSLFSVSAAGYYSLAKLALGAPSALLGEAVSSVFYPKFNETYRENNGYVKLFTKATLMLAVIGVVPFGIVVIFGDSLFSYIFGAEWDIAGQYAQWLSFWLYFSFMNRPSVAAIPVLSMQRTFLNYEIISVTLRLSSMLAGYYLFDSGVIAIALFSIIGAFLNISLILMVFVNMNKTKAI